MDSNTPNNQAPAGPVVTENEWAIDPVEMEETDAADGELQSLSEHLSTSSGEFKKSCSESEVTEAWREVFAYLGPEARRSLLEESPAKCISQLSPESKQGLLVTPSLIDDRPILAGAGPGGSSDPPSAPVPGFPSEPLTVFEGLASIPPEFLLGVREYLSPLDELLLSHTHRNIFHSDMFSFYRLDAEHQREWQNFSPRYQEERAPLLYHALSNEAPMSVIVDILDTWEEQGLDLDLRWAAGRNYNPGLPRPILFAVLYGRVDVIEELLRRGADASALDTHVRRRAHSEQARATFTDAMWWRMENLAIMLCERDPPVGANRQFWLFSCVRAGWTQLLRLFLETALGANNAGLRVTIAQSAAVWVRYAGLVRRDNSPMLDYLFDRAGARITPPNEAIQGDGLFRDWLSLLIVGGPQQPRRPLNAAYLLDRMRRQDTFRMLSLVTTVQRYIEEACVDDDALPLTRALHDGLLDLTRRYSYEFLTDENGAYDYGPEHHPNILRAYMLRCALTSERGAPLTVRWLISQGLVSLHLNRMELNRPHALQALPASASEAVLQANLDAILTRFTDPNATIPDLAQTGVRAVDLVHEHDAAFVELVARAPSNNGLGNGVDLTLAGPALRNAAQERRALRDSGMQVATSGRSVRQLMACATISYEVRRRILDWCVVNNTNDVPAVIPDV
ncbi:hypothetical protein PG993_013508 [Apiospora rasikravindrae]|uniref:Ankyrin repeat protein n=1 Tax=Apiospora rasikravindrae TaxID=990691 RepID=A0ABR1RXU7_9PEZI